MRPTLREIAATLRYIGRVLDADHADYCFEGRFRFELSGGWSLIVSADDAERVRLDACFQSRRRATMWCPANDRRRLASLALAARDEAAALAA